jgi:hypothetical protein
MRTRKAIELLAIENDRLKAAAQRKSEISKFSEPLARSAYDLQSRLYNILRQNLIQIYLVGGDERTKSYVVDYTVYLIAQFQCVTELVRREIQFVDLGENTRTRELVQLQDKISSLWRTDRYPALLRIFAGEQRALGEALIYQEGGRAECIGYGAFLKNFIHGTNLLIDSLRADVAFLATGTELAAPRLKSLQNALIDLLLMLDPDHVRFPLEKRAKV